MATVKKNGFRYDPMNEFLGLSTETRIHRLHWNGDVSRPNSIGAELPRLVKPIENQK